MYWVDWKTKVLIVSLELAAVYNSRCVCLNLSGEILPALKPYKFREVKTNVDLRDKKFRQKIFERLSRVVEKGDVVFMVPPLKLIVIFRLH